MTRSRLTLKAATLLGLAALTFAAAAEPARAGLFHKERDVVVVPSTAYVVADPYVVTSSYVAVPTETVVEVPARRVVTTRVERVVVPSRRVVAVPTEEVYVVPSRQVVAVPEVVVPTVLRPRVLVPSTMVYEIYP